MSDELLIVGGVGGVEVEYDDLAEAAHALQSGALDVAAAALQVRHVLADPGLLASAVLDPVGFGRVEVAVLAAVAGPGGLLAAAARLEEHSVALHGAVTRYAAADRLGTGLREARHWAEGVAAAALLPLAPLVALSPAGAAAAWWAQDGRAEALLAEHPGVAEDVSGASPAFLDTVLAIPLGPLGVVTEILAPPLSGHRLFATSVADAAGLIGLLYPDGTPVVVGRGVDTAAPAAPRDVTDLLAALGHRDALSNAASQGEIDVRRLRRTAADGTVTTSWVVDLPGTKQWQLDPRNRDHLNDLATNLTTMAGDPSPRVDGLTRALELAGVGRDEPVMLVGHSQGGLVAMRAAQDYAATGRFTVTHVVTAGSPTARMEVPPAVSVLSLENRYDVVPRLDGAPPPPDDNRVTVVFDAQNHDVGANHAIATAYLPGAGRIDDDLTDASLVAWRAGASAFLTPENAAVEVRTTVWDIRNGG